MIESERIRTVFNFDRLTGILTWKVATSRKIRVGAVAGCPDGKGYIVVGIDNKQYMAHRVAWKHMFGEWPTNKIDHRNGDRCDNSELNIRDVSDAINSQNQVRPPINSSSGLLGVSWDAVRQKWTAHISLNGKATNLGRFDDKHEAYAVYLEAKRRLHEGCTI